MNILLINPSQRELYGKFTAPEVLPLGLAYLGAMLEKYGHKVSIVDIDADRITPDLLIHKLNRDEIHLVGITVLTPTFHSGLKTACLIKDNSDSKIVLGGVHPSLMPEECLENEEVDFVVIGEGEQTIVELVDFLEKGKDLQTVRGLGFRNNGRVIINEKRSLIELLDDVPFPAFHLFNNTNYFYPDTITRPIFPIITSRGCPGRCTYCNSRTIFEGKIRVRNIKNVLDEIEKLIRDYGAQEIHIWDDNFATIRKRVFELRDGIRQRGISVKFAFPSGLRADFLDRELLLALKDMGTYSISLGIESGNQKILQNVKKNIKLEKFREVLQLTKEIGIETWGFFMFGFPGETEENMRETINFAIELDPDVAKFHILKPYPGTEIFEELLDKNLINDKDFSNYGIHTYPVHHLETLSAEDILRIHNEAYKKFYFRPSKLIKQLMRLRSIDRIQVNLKVSFSLIREILCR